MFTEAQSAEFGGGRLNRCGYLNLSNAKQGYLNLSNPKRGYLNVKVSIAIPPMSGAAGKAPTDARPSVLRGRPAIKGLPKGVSGPLPKGGKFQARVT